MTTPTIAENRRARFEYEIEERLQAGLMLRGWEVKALRAGRAQLTGSYVQVRQREAWLLGLLIAPLPQAADYEDEKDRTRKLLLSRKEIDGIEEHCREIGRSCVPLRLYWKGHLVKVELALGRGRKAHQRRRHQRERDFSRRKVQVRRGQIRNPRDG